MSINRDPDEATPLPPELIDQARELNLQLVKVCLDGDRLASFYALVAFLPPVGSFITSEDGVTCRVETIEFEIHNLTDCQVLIPQVYALPRASKEDQHS